MSRLKMNKEQWLKLYTDIHEMIMHRYTAPERLTHDKFVDIRDDILNILSANFERDWEQGLTKETKVTIHD